MNTAFAKRKKLALFEQVEVSYLQMPLPYVLFFCPQLSPQTWIREKLKYANPVPIFILSSICWTAFVNNTFSLFKYLLYFSHYKTIHVYVRPFRKIIDHWKIEKKIGTRENNTQVHSSKTIKKKIIQYFGIFSRSHSSKHSIFIYTI